LAAQIKPGKQGDVEIPRNGVAAMGTVRGGRNEAFAAWHPVNADVEKTSNNAAKAEKDESPKLKRHGEPDVGIKIGQAVRGACGG
jgi:hypothetical protein